MTDRYIAFMVVLDNNMREDDAQALYAAMKMLKGVATVKPIDADPSAEGAAEWRVKKQVQDELLELCRRLNK